MATRQPAGSALAGFRLVTADVHLCGVQQDLELIDRARANHNLLTRDDVAACGVSSQQWCTRLDEGLWLPVFERVFRHRATPVTWELRVRAASMSLGHDAALFGPTAAQWWGLEGFDADIVELVVPRIRRSLGPSVRLHTTKQWLAADLQSRDGVRTTSATRTIIDLASSGHAPRSIENALDSAIRLRLTTTARLAGRMTELAPGRRGIRLLREILLDSGGESFLERRFLKLVRAAGLPKPTCQVVHKAGGAVIRVDFEFVPNFVVVEVTGRLGHTSDRDRQKDARRRNTLQHLGKVVIEFTTIDVLSAPDYVLSTLQTSGVVTRPPSPPRSKRDNPGYGVMGGEGARGGCE